MIISDSNILSLTFMKFIKILLLFLVLKMVLAKILSFTEIVYNWKETQKSMDLNFGDF